jgi:hypothetical protein
MSRVGAAIAVALLVLINATFLLAQPYGGDFYSCGNGRSAISQVLHPFPPRTAEQQRAAQQIDPFNLSAACNHNAREQVGVVAAIDLLAVLITGAAVFYRVKPAQMSASVPGSAAPPK